MPNTTSYSRTVIEHTYKVPCNEPHGGTWDDFDFARHQAKKKADELGLGTGFADWSRIYVDDDSLRIVVTEERPAQSADLTVEETVQKALRDLNAVESALQSITPKGVESPELELLQQLHMDINKMKR